MLKRIVPLFIILMLVAACGLQNIPADQTPIAAYTSARVAFNDYLSSYLAYRDVMPAGPEKEALKAKFEPKFEQGKQYLDGWRAVLGSPTEQEKKRLFDTLFDSLVVELLRAGVIQTKKGG